MLFKIIKAITNFGSLRFAVRLRAIAFLTLAFIAINFHVLIENATTMPPHSVAFGTTGQIEPALETSSSDKSQRALTGYYTADPTGTSALYPFDHFALHSLAQGEIPFWNPYTLTGLPFLAEYQWGIFYPPNWLRYVIPESWWDLYNALHVLLLALIVYRIARAAYGNYRSAIFAGLAVFGIGFILLYFPTHTVIVVAPWGAMLILGIERLVKKEWDFAGVAFVVMGVYGLGTAGHPTPAIFWLISVSIFALTRFILDRKTIKALVPFLTSSALATLAAAPNLIPFIQYLLTNEAIANFDSPMFYRLRDLFMFLFPYVFGPLNFIYTPELISRINTPGFLLLTSFMMFPAFVGGWFGLKHRNTQLITLIITGLIFTFWAFGVPPISWLSSLPLLTRLTFHYSLIIPSMILCILAGYGYGVIRQGSFVQLRKFVFAFVGLYLLAALAVLGYLASVGAIQEFLGIRRLLFEGFFPSLAFAILGPLLILGLLYWLDHRSEFQVRAGLLSSVLLIGFGFSVAAVYPTASGPGMVRLPLLAFAAFVFVSFCFAAFLMTPQKQILRLTTSSVVALTLIAGFVAIANFRYPGLPKRYEIVQTPKFIDLLLHKPDGLNWRAYGMNGAIPLNNLIRFELSAVNNQNALVPAQLRSFIFNYLDSEQAPTLFFGFPYLPKMNPSSEYIQNIRYWEYISVRYLIVDAARYPTEESNLWQKLGFEPINSSSSELVVLPQLSKRDSGSGLVQQVDCSEGAFSAVRIRLGSFGKVNPGKIVLKVTDQSNVVLARASLDSSKIVESYFHLFHFKREICTDPSQKVSISISQQGGKPGLVIAAWRSDNRTVDILRIFSHSPSSSYPLHLIYTDDETGIAVFEDPKAAPRAYFTNRFSLAPDWLAAQTLFAQQTDPRAIAFGEDNKNTCQSSSNSGGNSTGAVVNITALRSSSISILAKVPSAGTLVLVDTFMPGWTAVVDGKPQPVLRINGVFRGVCLDHAGTHNITMQYRPPYWTLAVFLAAAGWLGIVLILFYAHFRSHKIQSETISKITTGKVQV